MRKIIIGLLVYIVLCCITLIAVGNNSNDMGASDKTPTPDRQESKVLTEEKVVDTGDGDEVPDVSDEGDTREESYDAGKHLNNRSNIPDQRYIKERTGVLVGKVYVLFPWEEDATLANGYSVYVFWGADTTSRAHCFVDKEGYYIFKELPIGRCNLYVTSDWPETNGGWQTYWQQQVFYGEPNKVVNVLNRTVVMVEDIIVME